MNIDQPGHDRLSSALDRIGSQRLRIGSRALEHLLYLAALDQHGPRFDDGAVADDDAYVANEQVLAAHQVTLQHLGLGYRLMGVHLPSAEDEKRRQHRENP